MTAADLFWPTTKSMLQNNTRRSKATGRLAHSRRRGYRSPLGLEVTRVVDCVSDSSGISSEKSLIPLILSLLSESRFAQGFATPLRSPSLAHRSKGCFLATAIAGLLSQQPRDRKGEERAQTENLRAPRGGCELRSLSGGGIYSARIPIAR
jgi:hypothetical protein